ncbi:environmental stress-induced protein Ves [Acetoanaerobium pronyense]|uniref:Environmental stress-induced protein Ves n=1 Tax=Acetoanaerobium pronyense TaxID=1482736 RepID=A0ABS4KMM2_9FIRM|nr:HutD family protein [Acetoanaerobium pronyense]MBP2029000.1 environmental stress-induced protein Ves [Acetoanaerobium pronyense]
MKEFIFKKEDFKVTKWAGGETTQLAIYPYDADFSERNFLWRVSSATFTSTSSEFSNFNGFQRYILPLKGKLNLYHEKLYERKLSEFEAEYFDGGWKTVSENTLDCMDYNFIVKNGSNAKLQIIGQEGYILKPSHIVTMFSLDELEIEIEGFDEIRKVDGFSLFVIENDKERKAKITKATSPVIVTEFELR